MQTTPITLFLCLSAAVSQPNVKQSVLLKEKHISLYMELDYNKNDVVVKITNKTNETMCISTAPWRWYLSGRDLTGNEVELGRQYAQGVGENLNTPLWTLLQRNNSVSFRKKLINGVVQYSIKKMSSVRLNLDSMFRDERTLPDRRIFGNYNILERIPVLELPVNAKDDAYTRLLLRKQIGLS